MDSSILILLFVFILLIGGGVYIYFGTNLLKIVGSNCTPSTTQTVLNGVKYNLNSSKVCTVKSCKTGYTLTGGVCVANSGTSSDTSSKKGQTCTPTSELNSNALTWVYGTDGTSCIVGECKSNYS